MTFSYDHNTSLGHLAGLASRLLSQTLAARFKASGINMTAEQWGAVLVLLNGDAQTQTELGQRLYLEKSSVSRLVNGIERRGWVRRTRDSRDSRQKRIAPTPEALSTAERCAVIATEVIDDARKGMTPEEQQVCQRLLSRIITNLKDGKG